MPRCPSRASREVKNMVNGSSTLVARKRPTARQRTRRCRSRRLSLGAAVRRAVDVFFRFTHRAAESKALWSELERVWMGRATFLDWALSDPDIDIPWVVALAADAPPVFDDLVSAVRDELIAYWTIQFARLPPAKKPRWLPLP
jgi:hypothetical protein